MRLNAVNLNAPNTKYKYQCFFLTRGCSACGVGVRMMGDAGQFDIPARLNTNTMRNALSASTPGRYGKHKHKHKHKHKPTTNNKQ
jgi:hypothetical protein